MVVVLSRLSFYHSLSAFYQIISLFILHSINVILQLFPKKEKCRVCFPLHFKNETHCAKCIDTSNIIICLFHIFLKTFITIKVLFVIKVKKMLHSKLLYITFLQIEVSFISLQIPILVQLILCFS